MDYIVAVHESDAAIHLNYLLLTLGSKLGQDSGKGHVTCWVLLGRAGPQDQSEIEGGPDFRPLDLENPEKIENPRKKTI